MNQDQNITQEIKNKLDIVEFIGKFVPLKSTGKNYSGICPFHNEKTPSFMVNPEIQRYKCFGCGKAGDIFNFIQEVESLDFPEAVERLAKEAGIEYTKFNRNSSYSKIEEINQIAQNFYSESLKKSSVAMGYLQSRGFTDETINFYNIGFAPSFNSLLKYILPKKYSPQILEQSGLFTLKNNRLNDKFNNRIMFPIKSVNGRIVGFSGRNLPGDSFGPKYLNSPETAIFKKRETLFNIYEAKSALKKNDLCIICEGQIDAISAYSKKIFNVVAPLGTGLTDQQLELIKRYTNKILFFFDKDIAGQNACERAFIMANKYQFITYASNPEPYQDVDEILQKEPDLIKEKLKNKTDAYTYLLINLINKTDLTSLSGISKISNYHNLLISNVTNKQFLTYYNKQFTKLTGINPNSNTNKKDNSTVNVSNKTTSSKIIDQSNFHIDQELYILLCTYKYLGLEKIFNFNLKYFTNTNVKNFVKYIKKEKIFDISKLLESEVTPEDVKSFAENIIMQQDEIDDTVDIEKEIKVAYNNIKITYYKNYLNQIQYQISQAEEMKQKIEIDTLSQQVLEITLKIKDLNDKASRLRQI